MRTGWERGIMSENNSKSVENKKRKKNALFSSAYELFITKGFNETAISDIVKKAGVAKGTFYLYFRDKNDLLDKIILKKSSNVIKNAYEKTLETPHENFVESIIYFADDVITSLESDVLLLKVIHKNLSWGLFRKALADNEQYKDMDSVYKNFLSALKSHQSIVDEEEVKKMLFLIIELVGSVCYSAIVLKEPAPIGEMKPILFNMIRKMLS